jgi:hypothetical protein
LLNCTTPTNLSVPRRQSAAAPAVETADAERVALVERFAEQKLGSTRVYRWAIRNGTASDGK